jgi:hypothetical protein
MAVSAGPASGRSDKDKTMAKGQKRSTREMKKPKADKKPTGPSAAPPRPDPMGKSAPSKTAK